MLLANITSPVKRLSTKQNLVAELQADRPEILLTLGAGDIDMLVEPIRLALSVK
jgi:UDP-N-acetylmuramate--alanine ligase